MSHLDDMHAPDETSPLHLKPIISYPREAQAGQSYVMSIDVQLATPDQPWDYPEEEYPISFILNTYPYFEARPLSPKDPVLVLHRLGGTYGPVEYLLKAADHEIEPGNITVTFVNGWGIPMTRMELECSVKSASLEELEAREVEVAAEEVSSDEIDYDRFIDGEDEDKEDTIEPYPLMEVRLVREQLEMTGWHVLPIAILGEITSHDVALRFYDVIEDCEQYFLFTRGELAGIVVLEPLGSLLSGNEEEISMNEKLDFLAKMEGIHGLKSQRRVVPFVYEATGAETRFVNYLEPEPCSRKVFTFHQPETLARWLTQAPPTLPSTRNDLLRSRLQRMPRLERFELPAYQFFEAVSEIERSLAENRARTFIQVEAGKATIAAESMHRLLKHANVHRILYLVDQNVGDLAGAIFTGFMQPGWERYPGALHIRTLRDTIDPTTTIYVTTLSAVSRLLFEATKEGRVNDEIHREQKRASRRIKYRADLPIEFFDIIFISDNGQSADGQWRALFDYFDAFIIGIETEVTDKILNFYQRNLVYSQSKPPEENKSVLGVIRSWRHYSDNVQGEIAAQPVTATVMLSFLLWLQTRHPEVMSATEFGGNEKLLALAREFEQGRPDINANSTASWLKGFEILFKDDAVDKEYEILKGTLKSM